ncbi:hypothetical protein HA45_15990 [Pantoea rodasii]|nr:hypothetical protein HA45_15990 [Pantoea rodasii]
MNILSIDANNWVALGLQELLKPHHQLISCASLGKAKQVLIYQHIDAIIIELKTEVDDVESIYAFLRLIQALYPQVRVRVLTAITDAALLNFFTHEINAVQVMTKKASLNKILSSLNLTTELPHKMLPRSSLPALSQQEFNMLKWFARFSSQQEIALRVRLHNKTISHYKRSIYSKLHCENNVQFHERLMQYGFNRTHLT